MLLPRGTSSPEAVREAVVAGARAVLVDGPLPAGALGTDGPAEVPILGLSSGDADTVRGALRDAVPVILAVGAAAFDENAERGEAAPFSSEGLSFDGGPKPEVSAAGVGLATSDPGRNEDGAARYGTLSGSSAAAALAAGAAALLARRDPTSTLRGSSKRSSRRRAAAAARPWERSTRPRRPRSSSSPRRRRSGSASRSGEGTTVRRRIVAAQRQPAQARRLDRARHRGRGRHRRRDPPARRASAPGASLRVARSGHSAAAPAGRPGPHRSAPRQDPRRLHVAGPVDDRRPAVPKRDLIPVARLSSRAFEPSDASRRCSRSLRGASTAPPRGHRSCRSSASTSISTAASKRLGRLARCGTCSRAATLRHHRPGPGRQAPAARRVPLRLAATPVGGARGRRDRRFTFP